METGICPYDLAQDPVVALGCAISKCYFLLRVYSLFSNTLIFFLYRLFLCLFQVSYLGEMMVT